MTLRPICAVVTRMVARWLFGFSLSPHLSFNHWLRKSRARFQYTRVHAMGGATKMALHERLREGTAG